MTVFETYAALERYIQALEGKIFLVCGPSFAQTRPGRFLQEQSAELVRFSGFRPNPDLESVAQGAALFRESGCGSIVAAGGGSAMDVAKCIRLYADTRPIALDRPAVPNRVKLLAIPTTAGSGSEATHFAVVYSQGVKQSVDCGRPDAVFLDPSALDTLPVYQRKVTLLDALCHGVESFWSVNSTGESRRYSQAAIRGVLENWEGYLQNTPEGNRGMLQAAHLAGQAIDLAQTTAGHAMSYSLTKRCGLAHGHAAALCVARLWPWMTEHLERCSDPRGRAHLGQILAQLEALIPCRRFQELLDRLELPAPSRAGTSLAELTASVNPDRLKNFPVSLTATDIERLYREILGGNGS